MRDWTLEKDTLEELINVEHLSYEKIGKIYGCCGNNIKKVCKKLGIELQVRNKNAGKTPYNKGRGKKYYCLYCGKELNKTHLSHKYCSNKCQQEYIYKKYIEDWQNGIESGTVGTVGVVSGYVRRYIFSKYSNKCCLCGWGEENPYTHTIPLEIDHIDGDYTNNKEDNLRLLCPNCHSLTPTYRGANRGNGRPISWYVKKE